MMRLRAETHETSVLPVRRGVDRSSLAEGLAALGRKRIASVAFVVSVALCIYFSPAAFGDVLETDVVGTTEISSAEGTNLAADAPDVDCSTGILATSDGKVLWQRDPGAQVAMASITKVMTALVALEIGDLSDEITVSENAADVEGSTAELVAGDVLTLEDLLYCMMLPSGNDAATALAEYYGDGDEQTFVQLMNEKAAELGMASTAYSSASGIEDEGNYTTAADCLALARAAMANDTFREVVSASSYTYHSTVSGSDVVISTSNELLGEVEGVNGIKTGYTDAAGYCLIGSAERSGVELYAIALGSSSYDSRYTDVETLLEWGFSHYHEVTLIEAGTYVGKAVATEWIDLMFDVRTNADTVAVVFDYDPDLELEVMLNDMSGTISVGSEVGTIIWTDSSGNQVAEAQLVAAETVEGPGVIERIQILWRMFASLFTGEQLGAEPSVEVEDVFPLITEGLQQADDQADDQTDDQADD